MTLADDIVEAMVENMIQDRFEDELWQGEGHDRGKE